MRMRSGFASGCASTAVAGRRSMGLRCGSCTSATLPQLIDNSPSVDDAPSVTQRVHRLTGCLGANYWRVWGSSAASNLADGVFWIAFPLLAVRLTDEPVLIAGVTVVGRLPWLVFVLFAGALADRLDRRRTMISVAA